MGAAKEVLTEVLTEVYRHDLADAGRPDGTGGPVMRSEAERHRAALAFISEHGGADWRSILLADVYEAVSEDDPAALRSKLMKVSAVTTHWVLALDNRGGAA